MQNNINTHGWLNSILKQEDNDSEYDYLILSITEELSKRMKDLPLTKVQLAKKLGTSSAYVTKLLNGNTNFTVKTLLNIAKALNDEFVIKLKSNIEQNNNFVFDTHIVENQEYISGTITLEQSYKPVSMVPVRLVDSEHKEKYYLKVSQE